MLEVPDTEGVCVEVGVPVGVRACDGVWVDVLDTVGVCTCDADCVVLSVCVKLDDCVMLAVCEWLPVLNCEGVEVAVGAWDKVCAWEDVRVPDTEGDGTWLRVLEGVCVCDGDWDGLCVLELVDT